MRLIATAALATFIAGCQTSNQEPQAAAGTQANAVPPDYVEQTVAYFRGSLKDPYSVRDAMISEPFVGFAGLVNGGSRPVVCVQMNAKNSFGAYTGAQATAVFFNRGQVAFSISDNPIACSGQVRYLPFHALNGA